MNVRRLEKIDKQLKLNGNIRDVTWFTNQFRKGRIKIRGNSSPISETIFNQYKTAVRVISDIYDNNWDIEYHVEYQNRKVTIIINGIYILFPEVNITNRNQETHLIKDLLVSVRIYNHENRNLRLNSLVGGRLTLSYAEYQNDYFHSHLSISKNSISTEMNLPYLSNFCTGSGEINIYHSNINGDGFTEERFMRYAMQIMSLVSYESIEGTPYRYLSRISARPRSGRIFNINNRIIQTFKRTVINYYRNGEIVPKLDIHIDSSNRYYIADNENFSKFIYDVPYEEQQRNEFFCTLGENNTYWAYNSTPGFAVPPTIRSTFIFRNEEKRFIIEPAPESSSTIQYKVHPNLIKYLKEDIEYELNKNKIRKSTVDRYTTEFSDATESVQPNSVPMPADS